MPYIRQEHREPAVNFPTDPGELNFAITSRAVQCIEGHFTSSQFIVEVMKLVEDYLEMRRVRNYTTYNEVMGVLVCVPLELERRLSDSEEQWNVGRLIQKELSAYRELFYVLSVAPYEDEKIITNGDVLPEGWTT